MSENEPFRQDNAELPIPNREYHQIEYVINEQPGKRSLIRRAGCAVLLIVWFLMLSLPLGFFILAIEGQITLAHGSDVPDRHEHPRIQVRLVTEIDYRGLQFTNSTIDQQNDLTLCVQTNVRYLLWQGEGETATFCDCYTRPDIADEWLFESTTTGQCEG